MFPARWITYLGLLTLLASGHTVRADDWPQWLGPQRDGVWRETGLVEKFPAGGPKVLWRMKIGGGYAGPAVANGRVYVTDRVLDAGQSDPSNPFSRTNSSGQERLLCLDEKTGKEIWKHSYPSKYTMAYSCGPRATPAIADGKVYSLGAMGDLICLDARSGKLLWSKNFVKDYDASVPVWGFTAHPLVDGDRLICLVGSKPAPAVIAYDRHTGKELWRALDTGNSEIGYCPPMIFTIAGKRQLVVWHPEAVAGLEIETGKKLWSYEWLVRSNLTIPTPRLVGNRLFLTSFYNGSRYLELEDKAGSWNVREIWRSNGRGERPGLTDKLHAIMCTPVIKNDYIYGVCSYGELRCLTLKEGKRIWSDLRASGAGNAPERWANAFLIEQADRFFLFNEKGDLMIARLTPKGYEEIDRAHILAPTGQLAAGASSPRKVVWSHPAFANKVMFARNDEEIVAVSLAAP